MSADIADLVAQIVAERRIPGATYRLQFNEKFTFRDALAIVPYLHELGITDCYASPILQAQRGSTHGYDICDHGHLNAALGTREDFNAFVAALHDRDMGLILDVVPNHMGIHDPRNGWWMDVLENGPSSVYAAYFDVDWHPAKLELGNRVLLPILGDQFGRVLERGELKLSYDEGAFGISYWETPLPVAPATYYPILAHRLESLISELGEDDEHVQELQSILTALSHLPDRNDPTSEHVAELHREKEVVKRRIAALASASPAVRTAIDETVREYNGTPDDPRSFDHLSDLLDQQSYRPAFWRVATEEINYRRFFDINELAAITVERPEVFEATHQLIFTLLAKGQATGVRIDHPDGLWNPPAYFRALQERFVLEQVRRRLNLSDANGDDQELADQVARATSALRTWPLYVVAEKILAEGEQLPVDWAVHGTTGYEFLNSVNGLYVDGRKRRALDRIYQNFTQIHLDFQNLANSTKKMIMLVSLASEINSLSHLLDRIAEKNRRYRDFTLNGLTFAIREVIACLPVYRTYISGEGNVAHRDRQFVEAAVAEAKWRNPRTAESIFDFIQDTLLLRNLLDFREEDRDDVIRFVMKFQQVTGPVMAKGVEDTAFYVYNRLASLNEVGGGPERFGVPPATFHRRNAERQSHWPHSMLTTSTHDTKRGEDTRVRIDVLSELPEEWAETVTRWGEMNERFKTPVEGVLAPDRNAEYLLYQSILGAWPPGGVGNGELTRFRERVATYAIKAIKEAKVHTSWINPNEEYDQAVKDFVRRILEDAPPTPFVEDMDRFQRRIRYFGDLNSLSQLLLKLTAPGVPDTYQGTELWDLTLVDPDNRKPVDYRRRRAALDDLQERLAGDGSHLVEVAEQLLDEHESGQVKLFVLSRSLQFRRAHADLFRFGSYLPLPAHGPRREHAIAFGRTYERDAMIVVAPRLVVRLAGGEEQLPVGEDIWEGTRLALPRELARSAYRNVLTGEVHHVHRREGRTVLSLAQILGRFPLALLERVAA